MTTAEIVAPTAVWLAAVEDPHDHSVVAVLDDPSEDVVVGTGSLRVVGAMTQSHLAVASWKVMEKLGMRREEHSVKDAWHGKLRWVDGYTYAIVADGWRSEATGV